MGKFFENLIPKTKYGVIAATVTPIIIAAGAYVAWSYASRAMKQQRILSRSMSIGCLHGGKLALQRLINYQQARADPEISDGAENELNTLLQDKYPDFWKLRVCLHTFLSNFLLKVNIFPVSRFALFCGYNPYNNFLKNIQVAVKVMVK